MPGLAKEELVIRRNQTRFGAEDSTPGEQDSARKPRILGDLGSATRFVAIQFGVTIRMSKVQGLGEAPGEGTWA